MYDFVVVIIVLNLLYELIEIVFPAKKMSVAIKSFASLILLYALCEYFSVLFW